MILSDAIDRTQRYLDNVRSDGTAGARWSQAECIQKLKVAVDFVVNIFVSKGGDTLDEFVTLTATDGYVDLSSFKPLHIISVSMNGSYLSPATSRNMICPMSGSSSIMVRMVRATTAFSAPSDPITYGNGSGSEMLDELICIKAARLMLTKDRELDQSLESQFAETLQGLMSAGNTVLAYDVSYSSYADPYAYAWVAGRLYVGRRIA